MTKRLMCLFLVLFLLLAGCGKPQQAPTEPPVPESTYTVSVLTQGGMVVPKTEVFIYEGDELIDFSQVDEEGNAVFSLPQKDGYTITLGSLPAGYTCEERYTFTGNSAQITIGSALRTDESLSVVNLRVGDVMVDFTIATTDGTEVTLSEMLKEKDMVLLNFFYTTCGPCANEFPFMQQAYEEYADSVGIIALDPLEETNTVATYKASMGLTFPMAACPASWSQTFNISGYPTSVVVDRYGVICLIEVGAVTSLRPFTTLFDKFTGADYTQKLYGALGEMIENVRPNVTMPAMEDIAATLGTQDLPITYRPETKEGDAEYSWPFILDEKNGQACIKASNQGIHGSYAILYADVELKKGQAVAFDYLSSTESGGDILYVIVDGQDTYRISGFDTEEAWSTCYPWVALADGTHEVAFCYMKDGDISSADDTVYLKNMRIVEASEIDAPTYIPMEAAVTEDDYTYTYADIYLSSADGYYHVGSEDGPLLLANLMSYSQFSQEKTIWELVYNSDLKLGEQSFYDAMVHHFSYASNSAINGLTPVNEDLRGYLETVDDQFGFDTADTMEWIKCCKYYESYGTDKELENPTAGLSTFSAFTAKLGKNIKTNYFYYDRPIMPRGLLAAFTPKKSGVYLITSHSDSPNGVEGWIFDGEIQDQAMAVYQPDQRMQEDNLNLHMYFYMEAGRTYYLDICFWDIYETGYIYYDIEYVAKSYDLFRLASPGFFTYDPGATGADMYHLVAGGIDVVLGEDGIYYQDLGNGKKGSKLYCDFTGVTGIFGQPLTSVQAYDEEGKLKFDENGEPVMIEGIIQRGGFNFAEDENDEYILSFIRQHDGDIEKTDQYLRTLWGTEYDTYAEQYRLEDVYAGRYHGAGEDYTAQMEAFLDDIITKGPKEQRGCVVVTKELAELLQLLMDKFTFKNVDHSWTKLCYYYDHLGK